MKHLICVTTLLLSTAACSSDPATEGTAGSGGTGPLGGSPSSSGGSGGGSAPIGGLGPNPNGGSVSTAGSSPTAGSTASGGSAGTTTTGGTSAGGSTGSGGGGAGGTPSTGGTGPAASFKCDNLGLAPAMTGVAAPAGAAGGLKVLDWAGFKGAASFTLDDNTPSQLDNYAALKATGGRVTWFLITGNLGSTVAQYKATMADGQEIGNHTQSHQSPSQNDVTAAQTFIKTNFGVDANSMAAPDCAAGWAAFAPSQLFQNRGPCGSGVATVSPRDNTDPFKLPAHLPEPSDTAAMLGGTITAGKWRIIVLHGFDGRNGTYKPVPIAVVTGAMSKAVMDGYWVEGMTNVGAYWQGQKLIPESATTSATWTLPAKFPKNMCLRITTSGGTVTQKGETIAWDPHGYYQISLDAGEVTIK